MPRKSSRRISRKKSKRRRRSRYRAGGGMAAPPCQHPFHTIKSEHYSASMGPGTWVHTCGVCKTPLEREEYIASQLIDDRIKQEHCPHYNIETDTGYQGESFFSRCKECNKSITPEEWRRHYERSQAMKEEWSNCRHHHGLLCVDCGFNLARPDFPSSTAMWGECKHNKLRCPVCPKIWK